MQLVYLDEAGISNRAHEPHLVVAGVIVSPDQQWVDLETYFHDLSNDLFPKENDSNYRFVFHAKDIWHGSGHFDRQSWPLAERMKVLRRLVQVPKLFNLPIIFGAVDRTELHIEFTKRNPNISKKLLQSHTYSHAFVDAVRSVDAWMQENKPDEVAMLIAEYTSDVQGEMHLLHESYTNRFVEDVGQFRSVNIVDTLHFAPKKSSLLLQIADHCAFIIKRHFLGCPYIQPYAQELQNQIFQDASDRKGILVRMPLDNLAIVDDKGI